MKNNLKEGLPMKKALGLIEVRGLATAIEVADLMMKHANIQLYKKYNGDAALSTILIEGDLVSVQLALNIGKQLAERLGTLICCTCIPRPESILYDLVS